jgi:hypothetical protein
MFLEYHPQVVWYGRGDISPTFASTYKITTLRTTPFAINYLFDGNTHVYLPDAIGQLQDGSLLIAEAGMDRASRYFGHLLCSKSATGRVNHRIYNRTSLRSRVK